MVLKDVLLQMVDARPFGMIRPEFLMEMAEAVPDEVFRDGSIVELGAYEGGSTIRLAEIAKKTGCIPMHSVDVWTHLGTTQSDMERSDDRVKAAWMRNTEDLRRDGVVEVHIGMTAEIGKEWVGPICFLVIDAGHRYEEVHADIEAWVPHLRSGGMVFFDDYGPWDGTRGTEGAVKDLLLSKPDEFEKAAGGENAWILIKRK